MGPGRPKERGMKAWMAAGSGRAGSVAVPEGRNRPNPARSRPGRPSAAGGKMASRRAWAEPAATASRFRRGGAISAGLWVNKDPFDGPVGSPPDWLGGFESGSGKNRPCNIL